MITNKIKIKKLYVLIGASALLVTLVVSAFYVMQTKQLKDCDSNQVSENKPNECAVASASGCSATDDCEIIDSVETSDETVTKKDDKKVEKTKENETKSTATKVQPDCENQPSGCPVSNPASSPGVEAEPTPGATGSQPNTSLATAIISDAYGAHDAIPRGVPGGYSWREGSDAKSNVADMSFKNYQAINVWGQVFVAQGQSVNYNVRLQARNPEVRFFNGSSWQRPSFNVVPMGGAFYAGSFQSSTPAQGIRHDGSGAYSVSLSSLSNDNLNIDAFHWWWDGMYPRISIPSNTQGILAYMDMRLVPGDGYSSVNNKSFIASTGVDLFATPNTVVDPQGWNNGILQPRMTWVTDKWQRFYITTMTADQIKTYASKL